MCGYMNPLPLPVISTVKTAYFDVFGNVFSFFKVSWLILIMVVLFVELPMLVVQREVYFSIHPEQRIENGQNSETAKIDLPVSEKSATEHSFVSEDAKRVEEEASRVSLKHVLVMMGLSLLQLVIMLSFSVAWYRQLLFHDKKGETIVLRFGKMEWNFAITCMKAGFALAPVMLVLMSYVMASIPGFSEGEPINLADSWWLFVGGTILQLYLIARLSMSYPLTMMGQFDKPIKQSWEMTRNHAGRMALGFLLMVLPATLLTIIVSGGVGYLLNLGTPSVPVDAATADIEVGFAEHLVYKTIGSIYMLFVFALVSSFYARTYAFLVRSQHANPPHPQ